MDEAIEVSESTASSVFHELGFEDADELLEKAKLVYRIQRVMADRRLTQAQLGEVIGMPQAEVSRLLSGRTDRFTFDRLFKALRALGVGYRITLAPEQPAPASRSAADAK